MALTKGAASLLAIAVATQALGATFDVTLIDHGGDFSFDASARYWEPGINQVASEPPVTLTGANRSVTLFIISEGVARPGWRFAGEQFLTVHGSVQWSGSSNPDQVLRIRTLIQDLDNGHEYRIESWLNASGQHTTGPAPFVAPTTRVRWVDTIELVTGSTGTLTQFVSANHTMNMQPVPEPATGLAVVVAAASLLRRKR
ncbi:MAG: PEP-CTERM sorting domain-containing protein [Armatimonadota bacterium]